MTEYEKLLDAERRCHTIEIREKKTGKVGVANSCVGVALFYGADDGSDDKIVSIEAFNRDFEITAAISGRGEENQRNSFSRKNMQGQEMGVRQLH